MLYVARVELAKSTCSFIFDAEDGVEANMYGEELAGEDGRLIEIMPAEEFIASEGTLELCTF